MTITELYVIVGKAISNNVLFKHVLDNSADFRNSMKSLFEDGDWSITFDQFCEFINDGAPSEDNFQKWSENEYEELTSIYNDWIYDLANYKWSLPSGKMTYINRVPHDIDGDVHVVGEIVQTMEKTKLFEVDVPEANKVIEELRQEEDWKDTKIYIIPDDCACCS